METVTDFIFLGSKITVDSDYSHEIEGHLLLGRKAMTNLRQHIKKQRHYFVDKVTVFPVVMYGCGRRTWQPTPVFLPGESQGRGPWWAAISGVAQSRTRLK